MKNEHQTQLLRQADELIEYLDNIQANDSICFTEKDVQKILEKEQPQAKANFEAAIDTFKRTNYQLQVPKIRRFIVYWGYPGAGKSVMTQKLIERFAKDEDCLPFNVIDKDNHRDLFPNLFLHLQGGHIDECEKFAGVTIDYVRKILDISLQTGTRSILSIGSMGAGVEFKDNALKAISYGYKPCAVYMAVNKDIAYLSNIYRSATLYEQIIFHNKQLYPRLVSSEYFGRVVQMLPKMINSINNFQLENAQNVDFLVLNRANELLYDSRKPHLCNVQEIIENEENRPLQNQEIITINMQLYKIKQMMQYRYENNLYAPCRNEIEAAKTAIANIAAVLKLQYSEKEPAQHGGDIYDILLAHKVNG